MEIYKKESQRPSEAVLLRMFRGKRSIMAQGCILVGSITKGALI